MNIFQRFIFFIYVTLISFCLCSQDAKQEILNINKAYIKQSNVAVQTITKIYYANVDKPAEITKSEYYKYNGNYLSVLGFSETMCNSKYKINIDVKKKIIIVNPINKKQNKKEPSIDNFNEKEFNLSMDTVLSLYKSVKTKSIDENTNQIEFVFKSGAYHTVRVSYDKKTYRLKDYYVKLNNSNSKEKQINWYTISYTYLDESKLKKMKFEESNYVKIENGKITPIQKYNGFTIINNIKKNSL